MSDEWPSHNQEMTRKTAQSLGDWIEKLESGDITDREFGLIVTALYDATSGMIEKDTSVFLAELHRVYAK